MIPDETLLRSAEERLRSQIPAPVRAIAARLADAGFRSWLVGGGVRDALRAELGSRAISAGDWDLASDARPEQVLPLFAKVLPTGIQHGTVTIVLERRHYELTTLRGERGFSDGRRPDEVFFVDDVVDDLARRDFTVNALAFDLNTHRLIDPFDGVADLRRGVLRAVGRPAERFAEDGLRVLRAARFCSTLDMRLEEETRRAIRPSLDSFRRVSRERIRDEWWKALASPRPSACFRVQRDEGLLESVAPGLDLGDDALDTLDEAPTEPLLRFALLGSWGHPGGVDARAASTLALARELRLSNQEQRAVGHWVLLGEPELEARGPELRRWLARVGRADAEGVLAFVPLARRDGGDVEAFTRAARDELSSGAPIGLSEMAVTGRDLLAARVLEPGPLLGRVLSQLLERVLDDPSQNERARLLQLATELSRV